jgi:nitroreductase
MDFNDVIRRRKMVKVFTGQPLGEDVTRNILEAANRGPSAGFSQGYAFLVLDDPERRDAFWRSLDQDPHGREPIKRASLIVVPLASKEAYLDRYSLGDKGWGDRDESRWLVPYWYIDTGFAAMLMMLAAVNEGVGAQFFGILPPVVDAFRKEFGIPDTFTPIGALAFGHPDEPLLERLRKAGIFASKIKRRRLDELVHKGRW